MNEQAQKVLAELLQKALQGLDKAVEFSQAQIPDVVHQLLVWNFTLSFVKTLTGVVLILMSVVGTKLVIKKLSPGAEKVKELKRLAQESYNKGEQWTRYSKGSHMTSIKYDKIMSMPDHGGMRGDLWGVVCSIALAVFTIGTFFIDMDWLKIWIAPKLYMLEYAASLIK